MSRLIDPDDPDLLPPGDMPSRIADACRGDGQPVPQTPAETVRCVLDSLALAYRRTVRGRRSWPAGRSTSCTWSGEAPATSCCAS